MLRAPVSRVVSVQFDMFASTLAGDAGDGGAGAGGSSLSMSASLQLSPPTIHESKLSGKRVLVGARGRGDHRMTREPVHRGEMDSLGTMPASSFFSVQHK